MTVGMPILSKALVKSSEIIVRCFLRAMDLEARWSLARHEFIDMGL